MNRGEYQINACLLNLEVTLLLHIVPIILKNFILKIDNAVTSGFFFAGDIPALCEVVSVRV